MKYVIAIIKPHCLAGVQEALQAGGIAGMTVSEVQGFGRQKGQSEIYRGAEYTVNFVPKIKIEIATSDELAEQAVEIISEIAKTGSIGDGKIFVMDMQEAVRIRTGESGPEAL